MKNIDLHHHFIQDYIEDGTVKIKSICSERNITDPFTKNLSNRNYKSFTSKYLQCE